MSCETHAQSTVMRVMHVKLPSHSAGARYVVKAASQCVCAYLDRSLAMRLLKPSSLPQCVFAMRLRLPNVSSQCVCAYPMRLRNASAPPKCVLTMRLRHPMRLHNASALPMRLRLPMRLQNASAPANASAPIGPFFDECVFAMRMRLQVVYHTPPRRRNLYIYIYVYVHTHIHKQAR